MYLTWLVFTIRRQRGQSLVDYLMSNQSRKIGPELDRENAHFSVSEAMIAAIEEVRLKKCLNVILKVNRFDFFCRQNFTNGLIIKKRKKMIN